MQRGDRLTLFMWRRWSQHPQDALQLQLKERLCSQDQVSEMGGIKRAAKDTDAVRRHRREYTAIFPNSHDLRYNIGVLSSSSLVLVCLLPQPRDLEIARLLGWYRIPLRTAPKVIAVDYLAFYQPASFGAHGGLIEYVAEVRGHELVRRADLFRDEPDHPRAREEYYKIQIGPLQPLPHPIRAEKWRRLTFLYTTGEYLLQARTLADLVIRSEERSIIWRSLRERAENAQSYQTTLPPVDLPAEALLSLLGILQIQDS